VKYAATGGPPLEDFTGQADLHREDFTRTTKTPQWNRMIHSTGQAKGTKEYRINRRFTLWNSAVRTRRRRDSTGQAQTNADLKTLPHLDS
jgi:hypothetical protein